VVFRNEYGSDHGGLKREWYTLTPSAVIDAGLIVQGDNGMIRLNPTARDAASLEKLKFFGKFLAKAIIDGQQVPVHLTRALYRLILEGPRARLDCSDYAVDAPQHYSQLVKLLEGGVELTDVLNDLRFVVGEEDGTEVPLKENGSDVVVTHANKLEYVALICEHKMRGSVQHQLDAFLEGFHENLPPGLLGARFTPAEFASVIAGSPDIDVIDWENHTVYFDGYDTGSDQVRWFWDILSRWDNQQRGKLLLFATGSSIPPLGGFANLRGGIHAEPSKFRIVRTHADNGRLPTAHTCFNELDLPEYTSQEEMEGKLLKAVELGGVGYAFS
jgi:E3 ubiquitin-protein ligase HUWE1